MAQSTALLLGQLFPSSWAEGVRSYPGYSPPVLLSGGTVAVSFSHLQARISFTPRTPALPQPFGGRLLSMQPRGSQFNQSLDVYLKCWMATNRARCDGAADGGRAQGHYPDGAAGLSAQVPGSPAASAPQRRWNGAADVELGSATAVKRWCLELSTEKQNWKLP